MSTKDKSSKLNMFGGGDDPQTVSDEIYGGSSGIPDSGRVVARPTAINSIWADVRQPRRAIPLSIRMHWNGDPADVAALFEQWHKVAAAEADQQIDVRTLLLGEGEGIDTDKFPSVAEEFVKLVRLAAHIKENGLINPITVIESDGRLLIESGERRWLAHHLLHLYLGEQWAKVPAAKGSATDSIWRQAGENTQRRELNAIGMARQLALLIMAARGTPPIANGTPYREYEEIVSAGVCDRRYYAQVADGNVHRIPRGMGERIQGAMGLSETQLARYRSLLHLTTDEQINDALWVRADVENWPEFTIREVATLPGGKVRAVIERDGWTLDNLKALKDVPVALPPSVQAPAPPVPQRPPVTSEWMHKQVRTKGGQLGKVVSVDGKWITAAMEPDGKRMSFLEHDLTVIASSMGTPAATAITDYGFGIGDRVRTQTGRDGEVVSIAGRLIGVKTVNGVGTHHANTLMKLPKGDAYQRPPEPVEEDDEESKFVIGDRVKSMHGQKGGIVQGYRDGMVIVHFPGNGAVMMGDSQLVLEDDETPAITEDMIEPDVDPDAPQPPREYREGWTDGESGGTAPHRAARFVDKRVRLENGLTGKVKSVEGEWLLVTLDVGGTKLAHYEEVTEIGDQLPGIDTDKAHSASEPIPQRVIDLASTNWSFLYHLQMIARLLNDSTATLMLQDVIDMTDVRAQEMAADGTLKPALDQSYEMLTLATAEWVQSTFPNVLTLIENAGTSH